MTTSMVGLKTVTYTKISPKMVNPRDVAGKCRRRMIVLKGTIPDLYQAWELRMEKSAEKWGARGRRRLPVEVQGATPPEAF